MPQVLDQPRLCEEFKARQECKLTHLKENKKPNPTRPPKLHCMVSTLTGFVATPAISPALFFRHRLSHAYMHSMVCVWKSEDVWEETLFFYHAGASRPFSVFGLGSLCLYLPDHLPPVFLYFVCLPSFRLPSLPPPSLPSPFLPSFLPSIFLPFLFFLLCSPGYRGTYYIEFTLPLLGLSVHVPLPRFSCSF